MKRCPQCNRLESDEALKFCRVDGATLLSGSSTLGSEGTAQPGPDLSEVHTSILPHHTQANAGRSTGPTTALPPQAAPTTGTLAKPKSRKPIIIALIVAALVVAVTAVGVNLYLSIRSGAAIDSIAVLPIENRSNNPDAEYLCDGLAESLIYRLSQLPNLKVSPTSSVMRYKGKGGELNTIANELGVRVVLTGKLVQRGDNLTISVELIDVTNRKVLWGEQYDRKMAELLATQREIAGTITQKLELKLAGDEKGITKNYTDSNEAYQLYLKGRFFWNKRNAENLRKAIEQFQAAAEKDPNFALAFVGLADCHVLLPFYETEPSQDVLPKAKAYATRALEIDPSLGEAHASLAYTNYMLWNFAEAEPGFKRAIELSPTYATAHKWYGNFLEDSGRLEESLQKFKQAQELDPLSLIVTENLAESYLFGGDLSSAYDQCSRLIELDPNYAGIRRSLSLVYLKQGRQAEALAEAQKGVELSNRLSPLLANLGFIYAQTGKRTEATNVIRELESRYVTKQANGHHVAAVYTGLGGKDSAFEWLEKDFHNRTPTLAAWMTFTHFESILDDPRMDNLRRRMGLPPIRLSAISK